MTRSINFDGNDYAAQGPNLPAGYVTSCGRLSDRAVELTDKINGKVLDTQQVEVSPDGKTLMITTHIAHLNSKRPDFPGRPLAAPRFPPPLRPPERAPHSTLRLAFEWQLLEDPL
jgi:hypothetical protein